MFSRQKTWWTNTLFRIVALSVATALVQPVTAQAQPPTAQAQPATAQAQPAPSPVRAAPAAPWPTTRASGPVQHLAQHVDRAPANPSPAPLPRQGDHSLPRAPLSQTVAKTGSGGVQVASPADALPIENDESTRRLTTTRSGIGLNPSSEAPTSFMQRITGVLQTPSATAIQKGLTGLAAAVSLFLLAVWLVRRGSKGPHQRLPREAIDVLGRIDLGAKQTAHLVHVGNKVLLVAVTATGVETLTEVTDGLEVDRLLGLCRSQQTGSAAAAFQQVFQEFAHRDQNSTQDTGDIASATIGRPHLPRNLSALHKRQAKGT